jgi:hypothetical protein
MRVSSVALRTKIFASVRDSALETRVLRGVAGARAGGKRVQVAKTSWGREDQLSPCRHHREGWGRKAGLGGLARAPWRRRGGEGVPGGPLNCQASNRLPQDLTASVTAYVLNQTSQEELRQLGTTVMDFMAPLVEAAHTNSAERLHSQQTAGRQVLALGQRALNKPASLLQQNEGLVKLLGLQLPVSISFSNPHALQPQRAVSLVLSYSVPPPDISCRGSPSRGQPKCLGVHIGLWLGLGVCAWGKAVPTFLATEWASLGALGLKVRGSSPMNGGCYCGMCPGSPAGQPGGGNSHLLLAVC